MILSKKEAYFEALKSLFLPRFLFVSAILLLLALADIFMFPDWIHPFDRQGLQSSILFEFRIPKALTAILAGMALSMSGFILQQLFRNNLADSYILGVSSGASLAVGLVIIGSHFIPFLNNGVSISMAGFIGAFGILFLILGVSSRYGYGAIILLFGVIIGQLCGAMQGLLSYLALPTDLKNYTLWSMGSFNQVIDTDLLILGTGTLLGLAWSFMLMPQLSVMVLGEDVSRTLGVNTRSVSIQLLACTGILSGITTAYCGPVAFIGMAIPNAVRLLFRSANFSHLLLMNIVCGSAMALLSDIVSSAPIANINIPVNVTTALTGGPFILYILLKKRH